MLERVLMPGVRLRLLAEGDADELYRLIDVNREQLARWMPWAAEQTLDATRGFIRSTRHQLAENAGMQTALVVGERIAGVVGLHGTPRPQRRGSLGYWLGEEFQGRGAMTAAVRTYTDHAFDTWGLQRVEIRAATANARSIALAERLGYTREGVLRRYESVGEGCHDVVVYSMLSDEWPPARAAP